MGVLILFKFNIYFFLILRIEKFISKYLILGFFNILFMNRLLLLFLFVKIFLLYIWICGELWM